MKKLSWRSKLLAVSLPLFLVLSVFCFSVNAEVKLTDEEAMEMLNEMQESKKELETVQTELAELKVISTEQSQSYEKQLTEASKKNKALSSVAGVSGGLSVGLLLALLLVILL